MIPLHHLGLAPPLWVILDSPLKYKRKPPKNPWCTNGNNLRAGCEDVGEFLVFHNVMINLRARLKNRLLKIAFHLFYHVQRKHMNDHGNANAATCLVCGANLRLELEYEERGRAKFFSSDIDPNKNLKFFGRECVLGEGRSVEGSARLQGSQ